MNRPCPYDTARRVFFHPSEYNTQSGSGCQFGTISISVLSYWLTHTDPAMLSSQQLHELKPVICTTTSFSTATTIVHIPASMKKHADRNACPSNAYLSHVWYAPKECRFLCPACTIPEQHYKYPARPKKLSHGAASTWATRACSNLGDTTPLLQERCRNNKGVSSSYVAKNLEAQG